MNEAEQWRELLHKKDLEIEAPHRQIDWLTQQLRRLNGRVYGRSSERSAELQEQELHRLGLPVSRQTMSNWVLTAGERWLLPVYHALHKELLANKILHADETTLMVLREPDWISVADCLRWRQSFRSKRFRRNSDMRSDSRSSSQLPRNFFGGRKRNTRKILCQRVSMAQRLAMPCGSRAG